VNTLDIKTSQSLSTISELYKQLYAEKKSLCLKIPVKITESRICSKGELIQLILTWANRFPDAPILTNLSTKQYQTGLNNLFNEDYGFILALSAQTHGLLPSKVFLDREAKTIPRNVVYSEFRNNLSVMNDYRIKSQRAYFAINDWYERKNPEQAFASIHEKKLHSGSTKGREVFLQIFEKLEKHTKKKHEAVFQKSEILLELSSLFYELIENADRWGRRDLDQKSIRGALIHFHTQEHKNQSLLSDQHKSSIALRNYLHSCKNNQGEELQDFLEVSVFDNGPGLSTRFSGKKSATINTQYFDALNCFARWCGTSSRENEGQGLYRVVTILNKMGGLLQYRSGNVNIFRDFKNSPLTDEVLQSYQDNRPSDFTAEQLDSILEMRDFGTGNRRKLKHPDATGALFTFILPLNILES
jgi:hypothetical protein